MLLKKACKACHERFGNWTFQDERNWDMGVVYCPVLNNLHDLKQLHYEDIYSKPPEKCDYILEHTVNDSN